MSIRIIFGIPGMKRYSVVQETRVVAGFWVERLLRR